MLTDAILRLKVAFANLPMKGLFFWEGLLFLSDEEYEKIVVGNFTNALSSLGSEEKEAADYYEEVLKDIKIARKEIAENPEVRNDVEKIREALIDEAAHETLVDAVKEDLENKAEEE